MYVGIEPSPFLPHLLAALAVDLEVRLRTPRPGPLDCPVVGVPARGPTSSAPTAAPIMPPPPRKTIKAADRLTAINAHLAAHPPVGERAPQEPDWLSKVEELELRKQLARVMVEDDRGILRQKGEGKLWVREVRFLVIHGGGRRCGAMELISDHFGHS